MKNINWRRLLFATIGASAAAIVTFDVHAESEASPKHGGVLQFAVSVEPGDYDCESNLSFAFLHPIAPHYSTLLKFDAANYPQIVGDVAEAWDVSKDGLTYTFRLRPHVLFHDGTTLSSDDIKATFERIIHPSEGVRS